MCLSGGGCRGPPQGPEGLVLSDLRGRRERRQLTRGCRGTTRALTLAWRVWAETGCSSYLAFAPTWMLVWVCAQEAQLSCTEPAWGQTQVSSGSTRCGQAPSRGKGQDLGGPTAPPATEAPVTLGGVPLSVYPGHRGHPLLWFVVRGGPPGRGQVETQASLVSGQLSSNRLAPETPWPVGLHRRTVSTSTKLNLKRFCPLPQGYHLAPSEL